MIIPLGRLMLTDNSLPPVYETEKPAADELFRVSVGSKEAPASFNAVHTWLIEIENADGTPLGDVEPGERMEEALVKVKARDRTARAAVRSPKRIGDTYRALFVSRGPACPHDGWRKE